MAINAEKRDGKLTGRFRVELKKGSERYRKRFDTLQEAEDAQRAVLEAWERGEVVSLLPSARKVPVEPQGNVWTLSRCMLLAYGKLWSGMQIEDTAWAHMKTMKEIIGADVVVDAIKPHHIEDIQITLLKCKKSPATVNRYISHLRTFLTWCFEREMRTIPVQKLAIKWREEPQMRVRWITPAEEAQLIDFMPDHMKKVVKVAIETGMRRAELLGLTMANLQDPSKVYLFKTKINVSRNVPITPETYATLRDLIESGTMPTARNVRSWWNRAKKHMGLEHDKAFVFHTCRHTCATRFLEAGLPTATLKEWMGHKNIETTLRYAHVHDEMLQQALHMRGKYEKGRSEQPQYPAGFTVPHRGETCGVNEAHLAKAA